MRKIEEEFKEKLFALLREYDVEMSVEESTRGYYTEVDGIGFFAYEKYDADGNPLGRHINFGLGTRVDGK